MLEKHLDLGALATGASTYQGHHREFGSQEMAIGLIPLGDRNRDLIEYGVAYVEERGLNGNDGYSKYLK